MALTETSKGRGLTLPLRWLASLDAVPAHGALGDAFGDSFLCNRNPVFAKIRCSALEFGYRFSADDTPMWRDYQTFGLGTLHQILTNGIIPYHDTGNTVKRLLASNPKITLSPDALQRNFKRNHAFHESAHCVASSILQRLEPDLRAIAPDDRQRFVLEAIFAESFANTVEMLGSVVRSVVLADWVFYSLNS